MGRPLWREVGSVVFSCCWASPAQSLSGLSPAVLISIFYFLNSWDFPNLESQVPVFISPRSSAARLYPQTLGLPKLFVYYYMIYLKFCIYTIYICMYIYIYIYIYIQGFFQSIFGTADYALPKLAPATMAASSRWNYIATDGQSASSSWWRTPFGAHDQILIFFVWKLRSFFFM
jgi:hypothetical protein